MKLLSNTIFRSAAIFFVLYFSATALHLIPGVRKAHTGIYVFAGQVVMNAINPNLFVVMKQYRGPDDYDVTMDLYDKSKFSNLRNKKSRAQAIARFTVNRKVFVLVELPLLFLLSLIIATPIPIRTKVISAILGSLLFYLYISIYLSYDFEQLFKGNEFEPVSFWEYLTKFVGAFSLNEHILLVALLIWGIVCFTPGMMKKLTSS